MGSRDQHPLVKTLKKKKENMYLVCNDRETIILNSLSFSLSDPQVDVAQWSFWETPPCSSHKR